MEGAADLLLALRGRMAVAVASSGSPGKTAFSLQETGLAEHFEIVCTTAEVARGKPFPDVFLYAARRLALAPAACLVVEDSVPGIV
jgi:HAD superfamily hydrolase (TIGR01509 family)